MSIQTELTRLTNAKAAIQTAIEGKGVTVPSGTLLDGMAALIESIEAGGGNTSISGTYTFNGSYTSITLLTYEELISVFGNPLPTLIVVFYTLGSNTSQHTSGVFWVSNQENALYIYSGTSNGSSRPSQCSISTTIPEISESSGLVIHRFSSYYYKGNDYYYCVARFDG